MTPDPALARLTRFTPAPVDSAELLFAAGRASARTPWYWRAGVAGSLLANAACGWLLLARQPEPPGPVPAEPAAAPAAAPAEVPAVPSPAPDPWSLQALHRADLDRLPAADPRVEVSASAKPLSVLSGRSGEID